MNDETKLQGEILDALKRIGAWAWNVNAGRLGRANMAPGGTPDICCVDPSGWLEVKTPTGTLEPSQKAWIAKARRRGVRVEVVTSVREAVEIVIRWRQNSSGNP